MFKLEIETDNAAFEEPGYGPGPEVRDILTAVGARLAAGESEGKCRDSNGNTVGSWSLT